MPQPETVAASAEVRGITDWRLLLPGTSLFPSLGMLLPSPAAPAP